VTEKEKRERVTQHRSITHWLICMGPDPKSWREAAQITMKGIRQIGSTVGSAGWLSTVPRTMPRNTIVVHCGSSYRLGECCSLAEAVDAASPGDLIRLMPGTHHCSHTIVYTPLFTHHCLHTIRNARNNKKQSRENEKERENESSCVCIQVCTQNALRSHSLSQSKSEERSVLRHLWS
jgi:hypothetical protein